MLADLRHEGLEQPLRNLVGAVVVLAIAREVALNLKVIGHVGSKNPLALLVGDIDVTAEHLDLGILDCGKAVDHVAEARDTGSERAAHVGVDKRKLGSLVVILVMHIVDSVQRVHVQVCQPFQHDVVLLHHLVVVQVLAGNRGDIRSDLHARGQACLLVAPAVDGVEQRLGKVRAGTEELHLFAGLGCGDAAADGVVVTPNRAHHVVVLVLD